MINQSSFITKDNVSLYFRYKEANSDKWLIMTHGIGEHSNRYDRFFDELDGFNIIQWDLRGHGQSGGRRGYIDKFEVFVDDMNQILHYFKARFKIKEFSLFSHSMGALITCGLIQTKLSKDFYPQSVFLNAPPVSLGGIIDKAFQKISKSIFQKLAQLPISITIDTSFNFKFLSHDQSVGIKHKNNPLSVAKLHTKLLIEVAYYSKKVFSKPLNLECQGFVCCGTADKIVSSSAIKEYFKGETSFTHYEIEGAYHEIFFETPIYSDQFFKVLKSSLNLV